MNDASGFQVKGWARIYDVLHEGYTADLEFYLREAAAAQGPVLEVACGTGRLLLPMLERGIDVQGLDLSRPMLDSLRAKAQARGLNPRVHLADMRDFDLGTEFSLIIVALESFLLLPDADSQIRALKCFHRNLKEGGRLILDFSYPNPRVHAVQNGQRRLVKEFTDPQEGKWIRLYQTVHHDQVKQQQMVEVSLEVLDFTGQVVSMITLPLHIRFNYKAEFELLLQIAGFSRFEVFGGFNHQPLTREDQQMVWLVRK